MSLKDFKADVLRGARAKRLGIAPSKPRPRSIAEVQSRWVEVMQPLSEKDRIAKARVLSVDPEADPLTRAFGETYSKVWDLKAEAVKRDAFLQQLRKEHEGPAVVGGDPDRDRKIVEAIKRLEGELADVMREVGMLERPGRHQAAAEDAQAFFDKQATNDGKLAAHEAAMERARQDLADEKLAERVRALAEAEAVSNPNSGNN